MGARKMSRNHRKKRRLLRRERKRLKSLRTKLHCGQGEDRHHRKSKSRGGKTVESNLSIVKRSRHKLWHEMFGNMTAEEVAMELKDVWLEEGYTVIIRKGKDAPHEFSPVVLREPPFNESNPKFFNQKGFTPP